MFIKNNLIFNYTNRSKQRQNWNTVNTKTGLCKRKGKSISQLKSQKSRRR